MAERYVVVGGGLAGLMTVIKLAEAGKHVDVFSIVPVKRSHSVCAQGGINGAVNTKGEGDHPDIHVKDTLKGGDFLAEQPPVKGMCYAAPAIIDLLDRMGVPFNGTAEGLLDFRRFGGTLHHRTAFAGATTGQQLLYALDEQVRRYEAEGKVTKFESWEFLSAVLDSKRICRGICAMDLRSMEVRTFPADAIIIATGGIGAIFGKSTNSVVCTGSAQSALYQQGCYYANGEFIQVHPTSIPGEDKLRLMSESARGEGGRVWVPKTPGDKRDANSIQENDRWYFLEEWYPKYGNLVPRDVATRAIHKVVYEHHLGIDGKPMVYLDLTHVDRKILDRKLEGILEIYEKFVGDDPRTTPMKIFPGMHYTMGGLWVDFKQATNIAGIYAAGESEYQYHGANRLGANSLVSCICGGFTAGPNAMRYARNQQAASSNGRFDNERKRQQEINAGLMKSDGNENPFRLWRELGELMTKDCTVIRYNKNLQQTDANLVEMLERFRNVNLSDRSMWANTSFAFTRQLYNMLQLSRVIAQGARMRDESRGAHYKPDFPERDDKNWLKTTKAYFAPDADEPKFELEPVDISLIPPRQRRYDVAK